MFIYASPDVLQCSVFVKSVSRQHCCHLDVLPTSSSYAAS